MNDLESNLWKFNLIAVLEGFVLYYAFDKILMQVRDLSITQIVMVEIAFTITAISLEVPSGALADKWERRKVLALNSVFFMLNTLFWAIGHNFYIFLIGGIFAGVHVALLSGTFTSLVYDTLKQIGNEESYDRIWGRIASYEAGSLVIASILGSMIADRFGITIPLWLTLIFSAAATLIALMLEEPKIHRQSEDTKYWEHIKITFQYLWKHPTLYHLIALMAILGGTVDLVHEYAQLYFVKVGISLFFLGYLTALGSGIESIGTRFSYLFSRFQRRNVYAFFILLSSLGFVLTGYFNSRLGAIFPFLTLLAFYSALPLMLSDLHRELPSTYRATGESFTAFAGQAFYLPAAFGFGYFADRLSIATAYMGVGVLLMVYFLVYALGSYRFIR
ncbi:MAG TPA: MFS transporter [Anaerolineae bacterium]|nr:MFS transporter [Anaerolineae bacterium]